MTVDAFKEMMLCNEPVFDYNGEEYSICWPNDKYYVTASDNPDDIKLAFKRSLEYFEKILQEAVT